MSRRFFAAIAPLSLALLCLLAPAVLRAYDLLDSRWPDGEVGMHLQLGSASGGLIDGSPDWGTPVEHAMAEWNRHASRVRFTVARNSSSPIGSGNGINNVIFSDTIYGDAFDDKTLAVATHWLRGTRRTEGDIIFNTNNSWNSYRGAVRQGVNDIRRVALHELGHVLGLNHPDQANQSVAAIMNHRISDLETLTADDIDGFRALYPSGGSPAPPPPTPNPPPPPPPVAPPPSSTFPASTHPYADNFDNTWTYTMSGNPGAIDVTFDPRTETESGYDLIYVMDGSGNNIAGSPFTARGLAGQTKRVPGATLRIRLRTDGSITAWGFAVTNVTAASEPTPSIYPSSAHPYSDNFSNTWAFTLAGSPAAVDVTFDPRTEVEDGYDLIYVMDGNGNNIHGSPFTGSALAGQTKRVPGATVRIRLTTDSSIVGWGFAVTNVTAAANTSSYPASAHPYSDNFDQTWTFTQPGAPAAINVTFDQQTTTETGFDFIYVMDGNGNGIPGSPFTGSSLAGQTVRVPGSTVRIRLTTDFSITAWGFAVTNVTAASSGSAYPASAHPYADNFDQTWTFTQPGGPSAINVSFDSQTETEPGYDFIYVTDGNGNNIPGSPFTGRSLAGQTKQVPGATVRIRLTTDGSVTKWGFAVTNVTSSSRIVTGSAVPFKKAAVPVRKVPDPKRQQ